MRNPSSVVPFFIPCLRLWCYPTRRHHPRQIRCRVCITPLFRTSLVEIFSLIPRVGCIIRLFLCRVMVWVRDGVATIPLLLSFALVHRISGSSNFTPSTEVRGGFIC